MIKGRRLREYVNSLPNGLASYPHAQTKTTVALSALDGQDPQEIAEGAPEELAAIILNPPPVGVWMPATYSDAIFHLVCDKHYPSEDQMKEWCFQRTMVAAKHPLYSAMLRVSGARALFALIHRSHGLFQRGTKVRVLENTGKQAKLVMTFPARLHNRFNLLSNESLFRGTAELTGGKNASCRLVRYAETSAHYECSWS